ncbi:MAG: glycosyl transferase family protein [Pseudomonadota bacterium]
MTKTEHPFAKYVRTIARGPTLSRPLTAAESLEATRMILRGEVEPLQLGALLAVLRVRTEDPGEGEGFVRAVKETIRVPEGAKADLDWSAYAGKKRQLPWFMLSALLLAGSGIRVLMHGTEGHTPGRVYVLETLAALGLPAAASLEDAAQQIAESNFAYMPLGAFSPRLQEIIELKPVLGVRSPVNTFARMINPFDAPYSIQSIFHPNYREIHRDVCRLLGQPHMAVFKGEGGEIERRPEKPVEVQFLHLGEKTDEDWPAMAGIARGPFEETMDLSLLKALWLGQARDAYAEAVVVGTVAIALRLMGRAESPVAAEALARKMWAARPAELLPRASLRAARADYRLPASPAGAA